jgi:peptide/nickel transport system ATP-binding protein
VTSLSILRLIAIPPGRIAGGEILFKGRNLLALNDADMRRIRGNDISMIFQEPMTSLNPVYTCGDQIMEAVILHQKVGRAEARTRAIEMLRLVGGMRQRVMIAMALSCQPEVLIADEPTTALDVTIQAQILTLLNRLQEEMGMAILLITHDLGVVAETCDRVAVMYAGQIVEYAEVEEIFGEPRMPYTTGLLGSIPKLGEHHERLRVIPGNVPNPSEFPPGCKFHPRCPVAIDRCRVENPPLEEIRPRHWARCWRAREIEAGTLDVAHAFQEVGR